MKFKRLIGMAAGAAAISGAATADEDRFELLRAVIDGRVTVAIVNGNGIALAIEADDAGARIVRGLAAGAILTDLREASGDLQPVPMTIPSKGVEVAYASWPEAEALMDELVSLTTAQKDEVRAHIRTV